MLDMGFREDMEVILADVSDDRQTLFFSATMNRQVSKLIERFGKEPETVHIEQQAKTVSTIDQCAYEVRQRSKVEVVSRLLDIEPARLSLIFCNTKRSVDECTEALSARGYSVDRLHGDITQQMRERTLKRFRDGIVEVLVATDVAARGLDIDEIDIVINYDLPQDPEDYVHRIGRTGRAGRSGRAVSFVFGRDLHRLESIERYTRQPVRRERVPSQEQVEGRMADRFYEQLKERLGANEFHSHADQFDRLLEQGFTPTDVVSALIPIQEDREEPGQRRDRKKVREPRERKPRRERSEGPHDNANMVPLFFSLGKQHNVRVGEVIGMLYNESGIPEGAIGHVKLAFKHSRIEVKAEFAEQLLSSVKGAKYRGKPFVLDHDRGPRS
jgi:ATP-dependent RNA helicase DeaD